jgi:hypothetical protein
MNSAEFQKRGELIPNLVISHKIVFRKVVVFSEEEGSQQDLVFNKEKVRQDTKHTGTLQVLF